MSGAAMTRGSEVDSAAEVVPATASAEPSRQIGVLGSANMDLVVRVVRPPVPGETVFGESVLSVPGGKGLNQAVAAARAGGTVAFIGAVGRDAHGDQLRGLLREEGIGTEHLRRVEAQTGTAHITVDALGQNCIIVVSGANRAVSSDQVPDAVLAGLGWLVTQLELDQDAVASVLARAHALGVRTVLTPAPARPLSPELLRSVDLLVPNELEACTIAGLDDPIAAARELSRTCPDVVVTLGSEGSVWATDGAVAERVPAPAVRAVDTTGAGDTFVGALVAALAEGCAMPDALRFATAAASIAVTRPGATSSMPTRAEIDVAA